MSILSSIKKALVTDETPKTATPVPNTKAAPDYVPPGGGASPSLSAQGVLDVPSITADIDGEIQSSPAYALYKKFEDQLEVLRKAVPTMNELTRFQAAAATVGADVESLMTALESHSVVLANSASRFESEYVTAGKQELDNLSHEIEAAEQKVKDLTEQLGEAAQAKTDLVNASQKRTVDLGRADVDFKGIVTSLTTKYRDMGVKVQQYLGGLGGTHVK
jgi:exonuclease VII small subunit